MRKVIKRNRVSKRNNRSKKIRSRTIKPKGKKSKRSRSNKSRTKKNRSKKQCGGSPSSKRVISFVNSGRRPDYNHVASPRVRNYNCK